MGVLIRRGRFEINFESGYNGGLLLHDYNPSDDDSMAIKLRLDGYTIKCISFQAIRDL